MSAVIDTAWHPLADGNPPAWASAWGQDRFGVWVAFTIGDATQRLRWVPPGRFLMGSPKGEVGRYDNEGPQHEVTISRGFWLADTPCTQVIWQAVMGSNPSRFRSSDRPVEQVSWNDVQAFLRQSEALLPGLGLALPTEAQWEHACRAGTATATWAGDLEILGKRNAPGLVPISWYGGNSGVDFELDNGADRSGWPEKQYPHQRAGTHPVARKAANPWGLYDILGNVWEWCADGRRVYGTVPVIDPMGSTHVAARRVLRGGSWNRSARNVRSASRLAFDPGYRYDFIGFRCARVQP